MFLFNFSDLYVLVDTAIRTQIMPRVFLLLFEGPGDEGSRQVFSAPWWSKQLLATQLPLPRHLVIGGEDHCFIINFKRLKKGRRTVLSALIPMQCVNL